MAEPSAGAGTGELNVQSIDLSECKELVQPVPLQATLCRKGVYAILKDCPCKVRLAPPTRTARHPHRPLPRTAVEAEACDGSGRAAALAPASGCSRHHSNATPLSLALPCALRLSLTTPMAAPVFSPARWPT